jgi:hypothetical protein
MSKTVEIGYKGHIIRVSAVRIVQTNRWTVRCYLTWNFAHDRGEKTMVRCDLKFANPEEAMQAGVEFAIKWIDEGNAA